MSDIVERAECFLLQDQRSNPNRCYAIIRELVDELKTARTEVDRLRWFLARMGFQWPELDAEIERLLANDVTA